MTTSTKTDINENIEQDVANKSKEPDDGLEKLEQPSSSTCSTSTCGSSDVETDEEGEADSSDNEEEASETDNSDTDYEEDSFNDADEKVDVELGDTIDKTQMDATKAESGVVVEEVNIDILTFDIFTYCFPFKNKQPQEPIMVDTKPSEETATTAATQSIKSTKKIEKTDKMPSNSNLDVIKRNPSYIPRNGPFYEHDDRILVAGGGVLKNKESSTVATASATKNEQSPPPAPSEALPPTTTTTSEPKPKKKTQLTSPSTSKPPSNDTEQLEVKTEKPEEVKETSEPKESAENASTEVSKPTVTKPSTPPPPTKRIPWLEEDEKRSNEKLASKWNDRDIDKRCNYEDDDEFYRPHEKHLHESRRGPRRPLVCDTKDRWDHDKFNKHDQLPKTKQELIDDYGYDIRSEGEAPKPKRNGKYGKTPRKRKPADENAYIKQSLKNAFKGSNIIKSAAKEQQNPEEGAPSGSASKRRTSKDSPPVDSRSSIERKVTASREGTESRRQRDLPRDHHHQRGDNARGEHSREHPRVFTNKQSKSNQSFTGGGGGNRMYSSSSAAAAELPERRSNQQNNSSANEKTVGGAGTFATATGKVDKVFNDKKSDKPEIFTKDDFPELTPKAAAAAAKAEQAKASTTTESTKTRVIYYSSSSATALAENKSSSSSSNANKMDNSSGKRFESNTTRKAAPVSAPSTQPGSVTRKNLNTQPSPPTVTTKSTTTAAKENVSVESKQQQQQQPVTLIKSQLFENQRYTETNKLNWSPRHQQHHNDGRRHGGEMNHQQQQPHYDRSSRHVENSVDSGDNDMRHKRFQQSRQPQQPHGAVTSPGSEQRSPASNSNAYQSRSQSGQSYMAQQVPQQQHENVPVQQQMEVGSKNVVHTSYYQQQGPGGAINDIGHNQQQQQHQQAIVTSASLHQHTNYNGGGGAPVTNTAVVSQANLAAAAYLPSTQPMVSYYDPTNNQAAAAAAAAAAMSAAASMPYYGADQQAGAAPAAPNYYLTSQPTELGAVPYHPHPHHQHHHQGAVPAAATSYIHHAHQHIPAGYQPSMAAHQSHIASRYLTTTPTTSNTSVAAAAVAAAAAAAAAAETANRFPSTPQQILLTSAPGAVNTVGQPLYVAQPTYPSGYPQFPLQTQAAAAGTSSPLPAGYPSVPIGAAVTTVQQQQQQQAISQQQAGAGTGYQEMYRGGITYYDISSQQQQRHSQQQQQQQHHHHRRDNGNHVGGDPKKEYMSDSKHSGENGVSVVN